MTSEIQLYSKISGEKKYFYSLDNVTPSTITAIANYKGKLNLDSITVTLINQCKGEDEDDIEIKLVQCEKDNKNKDHFKESISISLIYKNSNVGIKLSENNFHLCGLKSLESSNIIIDKLINKIRKSQNIINYINDNEKKVKDLIENIKQQTQVKNSKIIFKFNVKSINENEKEYINMIFGYSKYFKTLDKYYKHLDKLLTIKDMNIIDEPIADTGISIMRNYIYSISVPINRWKIATIIKSSNSSFLIKYNNSTQHSVKLRVPFNKEEIEMQNNKKKKRNHHFSIYKTGTISQSGMQYDRMKILFQELMEIIHKNYDEITNMDMSFLLK